MPLCAKIGMWMLLILILGPVALALFVGLIAAIVNVFYERRPYQIYIGLIVIGFILVFIGFLQTA